MSRIQEIKEPTPGRRPTRTCQRCGREIGMDRLDYCERCEKERKRSAVPRV